MKLINIITTAVTATALLASFNSFAGKNGNGNGAPEGAHYNLNIISKEKGDKLPKMTGTSGHTIFVPLKSTKSGRYSKTVYDPVTKEAVSTAIVDSKIWLTPGDKFEVCDRNGFDEAYDGCDSGFAESWGANGRGVIYYDENGDYLGTIVDERKYGAVFMLPCNTNISQTANATYNCDGTVPYADYSVWARANGKPDGTATLTTCAAVGDGTGSGDGELYCSLENTVLTSTKGKDAGTGYTEVTDELTSLLISYCDEFENGDCIGSVTTERYALFSGDTYDWFWNYDNNGLRLAMLRFYMN